MPPFKSGGINSKPLISRFSILAFGGRRLGVGVDVVLLAVRFKETAFGFQLFDEFGTLQMVSSAMSFVLEPGWLA